MSYYKYDELFGYRFIENLYKRIIHEGDGYVISTNSDGFRNDKNFIKERETDVLEIMDKGVLVSLLHNFNYKNNNKTFKIPEDPNGCHFGWSDELFIMITNLDIEK